MLRALNPASVPVSPFYAQGIEVTGPQKLVFVSGQVGVDAQGRTAEGIAAQAAQAVANLGAVLAEAGLGPESITKITIYLTDPANVEPFMAAAGPTLPPDPPATTLLIVQGLAAPDLLVEIEAIAVG
ncbi:RidA family protein [Occultella kanbiaonis]|uniref:RidA family protein n=1 Tax=Occultella kanbiaonis TaxID=2675754 RepID=UPI0012B82BC2|nr:RidA family protein [Occultella kanbiaonis]